MKKSFIVLLSVLFFTLSAFAREITEDVAIRKASELMSNRQTNFTGKVNTTDLVKISGNPVYYIINFISLSIVFVHSYLFIHLTRDYVCYWPDNAVSL